LPFSPFSKYFSFSIMCRHKIHNTNVTGLVYIIHFEYILNILYSCVEIK
jgi:hypothetical protein